MAYNKDTILCCLVFYQRDNSKLKDDDIPAIHVELTKIICAGKKTLGQSK